MILCELLITKISRCSIPAVSVVVLPCTGSVVPITKHLYSLYIVGGDDTIADCYLQHEEKAH